MFQTRVGVAPDIQEVLQPQNLLPYFDRDLVPKNIQDITPENHLALRGQMSFYPDITTKQVFDHDQVSESITSYIPVGDYDAKRIGTYMGVLVSKSTIVPNTYVLQNIPQPLDTPLPTRVMTTFHANEVYPPIQGFLLQNKNGHPKVFNTSLLVGEEFEYSSTRHLGMFRSRQYIARQLFCLVEKAQKRAELKHF